MRTLITPPAEKLSRDAQKVNGLIKKAFGLLYSGSTRIGDTGGIGGGYRDHVFHLETISKPTFLMDPAFGCGVAGSLNEDGSVIKVRRGQKWLAKAQRYAQLYERAFNREVQVIVTDHYF